MDIIYTISDVEDIASQVLTHLKTRTILIYGEMGAGKTTFIKALVKRIGSQDEVSSPTYSIVNEYKCNGEKIFHFDLYRINNIDEAYDFGIEDYIYSDHWKIIEWPELIEQLVSDYDTVAIKFNNINSRILSVNSI
ncbi:tRNA (adenosine(37)-N6)-threonylcarbamoyltransferase complex ATPase subunit type 1 TsaE [Mangrovimonas spongiae]|uniref:tRNA threonylcarbamoyladenosine biosynthesis protein TsaE n=1 Tax=Mangrovimonas spongiae TaxID=2494697 RepID=A0A3R9NLI5_9FLAO|nr:tRNA (adenosine(37)-N6)-threonylcarbamoyltransferase complex ATPase subunit type 1 TsaE [Mangrovimonas spongiae]RSK38702.1 tRNA (adenosine(37)-N6)-threonylcarbamoyltransferase complex ATPase subunit type 1 TsaE [Mangrovimonas spongiae]